MPENRSEKEQEILSLLNAALVEDEIWKNTIMQKDENAIRKEFSRLLAGYLDSL
jgi:hypothetical protein